MSLNWKEINLIIEELDLEGAHIEKAVQPDFEALSFTVYKHGVTRTLLFVLSSASCRFHQTLRAVPKPAKPLRFGEFCKSRLVGGRIEKVSQIGDNRIIRIEISRAGERVILYARLWSGNANIIITDIEGRILDAMRRLPKRKEISGGIYTQSEISSNSQTAKPQKEYFVRNYDTSRSFNEAIDEEYANHGKEWSLDSLKEKARSAFEVRLLRIESSLEKLREKESAFSAADDFKEKGEAILASLGESRVKEDVAQAEKYFEQYKKAKSGLESIREEIAAGERLFQTMHSKMEALLAETNPLKLAKLLRTENAAASKQIKDNKHKRPGLSFMRKDWLLIVGRDAKENDELLRRYVKGADLWLHTRDVPGGYVFIKSRRGKSVPLDIMLDAGNLAVFYSKARNSGKAELFYTEVKYLRRAKNGPKGLVIPTQEKNLSITLDEKRLRELEQCRVE